MNHIIFLKLYNLAHQSLFSDWLFVFASNWFGYIMVFLAFAYLFFHTEGKFDYKTPFSQLKNKLKNIFLVFFSAAFAWILAEVIKSKIFSPRPFLYFQNVKPLFFHGGFDSFPSGHAMFFGALATSLYFVNKRIGLLYIFVALIVGFARVVSGVHFPLDIIFGYIFGFIIALIFKFILHKKSTNSPHV